VSTLVDEWHPSPLSARLVAVVRTLAVASSLIAAGTGYAGGGGLGAAILDAARLAAYGLLWKGLLLVLGSALVLDLAPGLVQMLALKSKGGGATGAPLDRSH
jgi:hypothetical protein